MKNNYQQCKEYLNTISLGTELFVNSKVGERTLKAYTRGEAHGEKFAEICKKNKTSVWIKLNNGEIIKEVHPSTFKAFLKDSVDSKKVTIQEWRVISESGTRYDFTNEKEAKFIYDAICSQGDNAQFINVWK